ncbi:MAG: helix-turn-helix domain-containing protein [Pseudonocardiales bacterium]
MSVQREPNRLLAAVMAEAGVSNKGLAARVRALAERNGHPISSDHVSARRWLDGSVPRGCTAEYIALALGAKLGRRVTPTDLGMTGPEADLPHEMALTSDPVTSSQRAWREVRQHLARRGNELFAQAAFLYEPSWRLPQASELSQGSWLPDNPISLEDIELEWEPNPPKPIVTGQEPEARSLLPLRTTRQNFPSYSSAIRYLDPPDLFENRPCYRLLEASLNGPGQARLRFGQSCFFDKIDVAEILVHELSAAMMNTTPTWSELPFRSLIADPFDLAMRTVNTSINTLTIRRDPASGRSSFFLLRRDPTKVATGGGLYCLLPAGEFQPTSVSPDSLLPDLDIWRNIVREYSEELLGQPEHDGSSGRPIDYEHWPFFRAMQKARERGELRVHVLGAALNALSLNAALITVAVIDSVVFDSLFHELTEVNAEGEVVVHLAGDKEGRDIPFDEATVDHFLHREPLASPNVIAALRLAWRHRATLLEP